MQDLPLTASLLASCPADSGLVTQVLKFVQEHAGSIVQVDHHFDSATGLAFSRIEWNLAGFDMPREEVAPAVRAVACCDHATWRISFSDQPQRLAIWGSRESHCLLDLLSRVQAHEFNADVRLVASNHPHLEPVARRFGVEFRHYPITHRNKIRQEKEQLADMHKAGIDLIVLARYMRILAPRFVEAFPMRIINIHHAFLPAFAGANPYRRAHNRGVELVGATAHYVNATLDDGPIIEQDVVRVTHRDPLRALLAKGRDLERIVLARAVRLHLENRVVVCGNRTVVFG